MPEERPIVRCAIHPAIGVARVGNAPAGEYYLAPEVPGRAADPGPGGYKNAKGQIRKEAARFRVYGYDEDGKVVREITAVEAEITWEVHLANRKAAWYKFLNAMDIGQYALDTTYRNDMVTGDLRKALVVDPGAIRIAGCGTSGPRYRFDQGFVRFGNGDPIPVPLGELRTDEAGRLLVLGGDGRSGSASGEAPDTFANNDGWHDDTSDGPVRATVKLRGRSDALEAEPAMVAVTPPNYGQGLHGVVTLFDVVYDLFVRQGWEEKPGRPEFWRHIYPIFERMVNSQWVNQGDYILFGPGSPGDLLAPDRIAKLADPGPGARPYRQEIFEMFREVLTPWDESDGPTKLPPPQPSRLPPFYGDGFGEYENLAIDELALTATQSEWLRQWADGDFDGGAPPRRAERFDELSLEEQPRALDRTPLEDCLGGPFHPGIELTWPLRVPRMWRAPQDAHGLRYRLQILGRDEVPGDDFGAVLTPAVCVGPEGPLAASGPGTLTRWLGIPWQTDEASCLAGYDPSAYLPLPSFWAARVPNQVLSQKAFERVADAGLPAVQRLKHFGYRQLWLRDLQGSGYLNRIDNMVKYWHMVGIVAEQPAPGGTGEEGLPDRYWVETQRDPSFSRSDATWKQLLMVERAEPQSPRTRLAAKSRVELAEDLGVEPGEVVHPVRRNVRRDQR